MANPSTGQFCWHELVTTDLTAATKFYGELLGWTFRDNPSSAGGTYRMFSLGETMVGGAMAAPAGVPSGWLLYVAVDDADSAATKAAELGGKIMVPVGGPRQRERGHAGTSVALRRANLGKRRARGNERRGHRAEPRANLRE